jgi:hypothetical protein
MARLEYSIGWRSPWGLCALHVLGSMHGLCSGGFSLAGIGDCAVQYVRTEPRHGIASKLQLLSFPARGGHEDGDAPST